MPSVSPLAAGHECAVMTEASVEATGARSRALFLGALLLVWTAAGVGVGTMRLLTGPPLSSPLAWFENVGGSSTPQIEPSAQESTPYAPTPEVTTEERVYALTRTEMLSPDVTRGRPQADIRNYPAYSDVGYYIEFLGADDDSIRVELLNGDQLISACMHEAVGGSGSRYCQFPSLSPGEYRMRVEISGYQTAVLAFRVSEPASVGSFSELEGAVITNPQWLERPEGTDLAELYPTRAVRSGRGGRVVLDCVVRADGRVQCSVASEDPPGFGFGEASLRASRLFRMSPQLEDGKPSEGGRVRVPITWQLAD